MNHIPVEVLQDIFVKLDLHNRVECMLVCRSWYSALNQSTLVHRLEITDTQYHKFKNMIQHLPYRAAQVEYLRIRFYSPPNFDKRELCNIFPNLQELDFHIHTFKKADIDTSKPFQFLRTTCKLGKVKDFDHCELALQLAMSNMCEKLKTLELQFKHSIYSVSANVLSQLSNMPVLAYLILGDPSFTLMDLETMHRNLHSIEFLQIKRARLVSGESPGHVMPAELVTALEIDIVRVDNLNTHLQFYKYIENKYSCVHGPVYNDRAYSSRDSDYIREVYSQGMFPLYRKIGSQVETFTFNNYCDGLDAFNKFDNFGMSIKDLTIASTFDNRILFNEELFQSNQPKSIQKLTLKEMIPKPMHMLIKMEVLSTLIIDCSYSYDGINFDTKIMNFTQLVDACPPTLTYLSIDNAFLIFDAPTSRHTCIKHLDLRALDLTPELIQSIETNFPQLTTLISQGESQESLTILLPKHNLDKLDVGIMYGQSDAFSIKTLNDDKIQYFAPLKFEKRFRNGRVRSDYQVLPVSEEELGDRCMWNLVCASVQDISLIVF